MIEVEADGFLYNMVRNIVGTLAEVAGHPVDDTPGLRASFLDTADGQKRPATIEGRTGTVGGNRNPQVGGAQHPDSSAEVFRLEIVHWKDRP